MMFILNNRTNIMQIPFPRNVKYNYLSIEHKEKQRRLTRLKIIGMSFLGSAFICCTLGMLFFGNTPNYKVTSIQFQDTLPSCIPHNRRC